MLSKNILPKLPNLRDGLALSYAAANKGNSCAATRAREAAYMEKDEPLVKKTQTSMLSRELPKIQSTTPKTTVQTPSTAKLMGSVDEKPKTTNPVWKSGEKTNAENLIYNGKKPDFTDNIQKLSTTPRNAAGIRFKAINQNHTLQDGTEKGEDYNQKDEYNKSFYEDYLEKKQKNNHMLLPSNIEPVDKETEDSISKEVADYLKEYFGDDYNVGKTTVDVTVNETQLEELHKYLTNEVKSMKRPNNIGKGLWAKQTDDAVKWVDDVFGKGSKLAKALKGVPAITVGIDTLLGINENFKNKSGTKETVSDAIIDAIFGAGEVATSAMIGGKVGTVVSPGIGTVAGLLAGIIYSGIIEKVKINGKSPKEWVDEAIDRLK